MDKELEKYRDLMKPPETFEEGFNWKTAFGAVFVGFFMLPTFIYLNLFIGGAGGISGASQWVTIILFAEVARRSLKELKVQEIYVLLFMCSLVGGTPFQGMLWAQYFAQSDYAVAMGIAQDIPWWWAPGAATIKAGGRTFFTHAWIVPILLASFVFLTSKIEQYLMGYLFYRITNDVERLPFPMAPVDAGGVTALVQSRDSKEGWRWRCFAVGSIIGMAFGALYVGVPAVTGALLTSPIQLIPIPWVDFTDSVGHYLPATPVNITLDITSFMSGLVIPFWAVLGGFIAMVCTLVVNPTLFKYGILSSWDPQMKVVDTLFNNSIDFYLSFGVGLTLSIALIGLWSAAKNLLKLGRDESAERGRWRDLFTRNLNRGDFSVFLVLFIYALFVSLWIGLATVLVDGFPWYFFVAYAFLYVPIITYASARLEGVAGGNVSIPYVREAMIILSGTPGVAIWFAPVPVQPASYAGYVREFRVMELTGTRFTSPLKSMFLTLPIVLVMSLLFCELFWRMAEIPSSSYPYAELMWDLQAKNTCLTYSATLEGGSRFMEAWNWGYVGTGTALGLGLFSLLSFIGLPTMMVYGIVRGIGNFPAYAILEMTGALVARFYFRKRFGDQWLKYAPIVLAGYLCGQGLIGMVAIAFNILTKMMSPLIY